MLGKQYRQTIALFSIFLVIMSFFTNESSAESNNAPSRQKRNIICYLGLTSLISNVCYEALKGIHKYDPLPIGSLMNDKLQNGEFKGLSTLRNDSIINVDCDDDLVILNTVLDVSGASINYDWKQKFLLTVKGSVWTKVKDIQFTLELTLNMTNGIKLDVTKLKLTKIEGMKFGFSGLGPLNPVIKLFGTLVLNVMEQKVTKTIEELLLDTLESEFDQFQITF